MTDLFKEIYESIRRNKLRTFLTGLAVSWGVFMLILLLGAGNGVLNSTLEDMEGISTNTMEVWGGWTSKPYAGFQQGRRIKITNADVLLTESEIFSDVIDDVIPLLSRGNFTMTYGKKHFPISFIGTSEEFARINKVIIDAGRFINSLDNKNLRKVVVINHLQAKNMLMGSTDYELLIGQKVKIDDILYTIIGVRHGRENEIDSDVFIPFETMRRLYAKDSGIDEIDFTFHGLETEEDNEAFEKKYQAVINTAHQAAPDDSRAIQIYNRFHIDMQMNEGRKILETALWIIGLFTLLGGIVGVSNIMLITVKERTHEFGIRKAIGASPLDITKLIIAESITITTIFGYVGMILGLVGCEILDATVGATVFDIFGEKTRILANPSVSVGTAIGVTMVLIVTGTLAGLFPARKAAKVKPIEALMAN